MTAPRPSTPRRLGAALVALGLLAAGCSGSGSDGSASSDGGAGPTTTAAPATPTTEPGPTVEVEPIGTFPAGRTSFELTDESRDTPANGSAPGTDGRVLAALVFYPAADGTAEVADRPTAVEGAEVREGSYPLVIFSHGVTARGEFYEAILSAWATAGYVVVAPDYPLSNALSPGGPTINDVGNQPGDASFLLDHLTDPDDEAWADEPLLAEVLGHVDADRIGAAGHSLGGITSIGLGYASCCADDRLSAVAEWAGAVFPLLDQPSPDPEVTDLPLLIIHGTDDLTVPYVAGESVFASIEVPRWFITLPGQGHIPPYLSGLDGEVSTLVTTATLDFLDAHLKDDPDGIGRLEAAVEAAGPDVATLETADT